MRYAADGSDSDRWTEVCSCNGRCRCCWAPRCCWLLAGGPPACASDLGSAEVPHGGSPLARARAAWHPLGLCLPRVLTGNTLLSSVQPLLGDLRVLLRNVFVSRKALAQLEININVRRSKKVVVWQRPLLSPAKRSPSRRTDGASSRSQAKRLRLPRAVPCGGSSSSSVVAQPLVRRQVFLEAHS